MFYPRLQTPQGESVAKPETLLLIILSIANLSQGGLIMINVRQKSFWFLQN